MPAKALDERCIDCGKRPNELTEYTSAAKDEGVTPEEYVRSDEGTYNSSNGHFLCDADFYAREERLGRRLVGEGGRPWIAPQGREVSVAMNFSEMLGSLKMGVDIAPLTDFEGLPHCSLPGMPIRYEVKNGQGRVIASGGPEDVVQLVDLVHLGDEWLTLYENGHPVFGHG